MEKQIALTEDRLVVQGQDVTRELEKQLIEERQLAVQKGLINQVAIAKHNFDNPPKMSDGVGQVVASIDPDLYHELLIVRKIETGDPNYNCFDDPDWLTWLVKKHEEIQVKSRAINNSFRVDGLRDGLAV